ncbi:MAG: hypothetical protein ABW007_00090 [Chitinophagaceae bacterium]
MITSKHIVLAVILASLIMMALIVEDWHDAKVVGIMVGIFVLGRVIRTRLR